LGRRKLLNEFNQMERAVLKGGGGGKEKSDQKRVATPVRGRK